jgi:CheY-like chemotaxis protein
MVLEKPNGTWQLLQILKLDPSTKGIPVIVCSSDSAYHEMHIAQLKLSGCHILHKPFEPDDLRNVVQEALGETGV